MRGKKGFALDIFNQRNKEDIWDDRSRRLLGKVDQTPEKKSGAGYRVENHSPERGELN